MVAVDVAAIASVVVDRGAAAVHWASTTLPAVLASWPSYVTVSIPSALVWLVLAYVVYYRWLCAAPRLYGAHSDLNRRLLSDRYALGSVLSRYCPPWYMPHGHIQNAYTFVATNFPDVTYRREMLRVDALQAGRYPGVIALDWAVPPHALANGHAASGDGSSSGSAGSPYRDDTPTVVLCHGLTGGSTENYVRATATALMRDCGYRCVVMNARGCGGTALASPQAFTAAYTDDLRQVVWHLQRRLPHAPLMGIGFSLGANILTKYVSEEAVDCPLTAAIAVSTPFDLVLNSRALDRTAFAHHLYHRVLGRSLIKLLSKHAPQLRAAQAKQGLDLSIFADAGADVHAVAPAPDAAALDAEQTLAALPESDPTPAVEFSTATVDFASGTLFSSAPKAKSAPCSICSVLSLLWGLVRFGLALVFVAWHLVTGLLRWVYTDVVLRVIVSPAIPNGSTSGAISSGTRHLSGASASASSPVGLTVRVFDEMVTRRAFGFRSVDDYYRYASTNIAIMNVGGGAGVGTRANPRKPNHQPNAAAAPARGLPAVGRPFTTHLLAVNSLDDPIVSAESLPFDECGVHNSDHTLLVTTRTGSHSMLFYEKPPDVVVAATTAHGTPTAAAIQPSSYPPGSWLTRVACAYYTAALAELVPPAARERSGQRISHPPPHCAPEPSVWPAARKRISQSAATESGAAVAVRSEPCAAAASVGPATAEPVASDAAVSCVTDELLNDIRALNALIARQTTFEAQRSDAVAKLTPTTERVAQNLLQSTPKRLDFA